MPGTAHTVRRTLFTVLACLVPATASAQMQGIVGPISIPYARFAEISASIPDTTGDGRPEIAVGAIVFEQLLAPIPPVPPLPPRARLFMFSSANGAYVRQILLPKVFSDSFPRIAGLPDVNGDGRGDIAVSVPFFGFPGGSSGRVFIYSGATGAWIRTLTPPAGTGPRQFAHTIAGIGDVNGDGRGDMVATAIKEWASTPGAPDTGLVFIISGATGAVIRAIEVGPPYRWVEGARMALAAIPDLNSDGKQEIMVGAGGKVLVLSSATGATLRQLISPTTEDVGFAWSISATPDANGDGIADLVVGGPFKSGAWCPLCWSYHSAGSAYFYSGASGALLHQWTGPSQPTHFMGSTVAGVPDINGDGRGDVVIGAPSGGDEAGPGSVFIFSGATGQQIKHINSPNGIDFGAFGARVIGLPNTNGNGRGDAFIAAPFESAPAAMSPNNTMYWGRAYFVRY